MSAIKRTRSAARFSKILMFILYVSFTAVAYNIYSEVQELSLLDDLEAVNSGDVEPTEALIKRAEANDERQQSAALGYLAALGLSTLFLVIWVSRVNRACRELGASEMQFTPGWAAAYWFIPIVNLYRPFQVVNELWATTSKNKEASVLVGWWWGAWIGSGVIGRFGNSSRAGETATLEEMRHGDQLLLVSHTLDLIAFALTIVIVTKITAQLVAFRERTTVPDVRVVAST